MGSAHPIDLTQAVDVQRCVDQVMQRHGRIDVLVNAAAINPQFAPVAQMSYEQIWVPTMVGEADIVFLMCKAAWPHLVAGSGGSIHHDPNLRRLLGRGSSRSEPPSSRLARRFAGFGLQNDICSCHLPQVYSR
jgi:NAD(P)-dependent dehydrogenase (short-subunit alcohol dehydrogenase family)